MAHVKLEVIGERHGLMQVGLLMCLDEGEYLYDDERFFIIDKTSQEYLGVHPEDPKTYREWYDNLPRVWANDRVFHKHFVYLDPYTFKNSDLDTLAEKHLPNFFRAWIEDWHLVSGGMRHGWDITTRKRPVRYDKVQPELYLARKDECELKLAVLRETANSYSKPVQTGGGGHFPATDIDIGLPATDRADKWEIQIFGQENTVISGSNAANASGTIDTIEIWMDDAGVTRVGTFSLSGNTATCRDGESLGDVPSGSKQTFSAVDIDVETGDYIGCDGEGGSSYVKIEADRSGGSGNWYASGQALCDAEDSYSCTWYDDDDISLYGSGEGAGGGMVSIGLGAKAIAGGLI